MRSIGLYKFRKYLVFFLRPCAFREWQVLIDKFFGGCRDLRYCFVHVVIVLQRLIINQQIKVNNYPQTFLLVSSHLQHFILDIGCQFWLYFKRIQSANKNIYKMHSPEDDFFNHSGSEDYSLEEQTSELMNEVFNQSYKPVFDPLRTDAQEKRYQLLKAEQNKKQKHKLLHHLQIYQNIEDQDLSPSFAQFLQRAQQKFENKNKWVHKMKAIQDEKEVIELKRAPDILRGSREKLQPIYERCIDLQKNKDRKLQHKRIQKNRTESQKINNMSFHPIVNRPKNQRTFQEYLSQKQTWLKDKQEQIQKRRVALEVKKLSECTFRPNLVAKYNKPNSKIREGEKVEQRLLRSLQKSREKHKGYQ